MCMKLQTFYAPVHRDKARKKGVAIATAFAWEPILAALALCSVLALVSPAHASWQDEISDFDRGRLSQFSASKSDGLREAGGDPIANAVVAPEGGSVSEGSLIGGWQCRIMKLGGYTSLIVYDWFHCLV